MVDPDEAGACPRCGLVAAVFSIAPPGSTRPPASVPRLASAPPSPAPSVRPPSQRPGEATIAVREPTIVERGVELARARPVVVAGVALAVVLALVAVVALTRGAKEVAAANAPGVSSAAVVEVVADPSLVAAFTQHTSHHAGLQVRLPPDFEPEPSRNSVSPGHDGMSAWMAYFRRERETSELVVAHLVLGDASPAPYERDEKLLTLVRTAARGFVSGMQRSGRVLDSKIEQCRIVRGPQSRFGACTGTYQASTGSGPHGTYCALRGGSIYCLAHMGNMGVSQAVLDAMAATIEPL